MHRFLELAVAIVMCTPVVAVADIVIAEQRPNGMNALNADRSGSSRQHIADDFSFSSAESITSLMFWGVYGGGTDPLEDQFTIRFFANENGVGSLLHSTPVTNLSRTVVGTIFGLDEYEYSADLLHLVQKQIRHIGFQLETTLAPTYKEIGRGRPVMGSEMAAHSLDRDQMDGSRTCTKS